MHVKSQVEVCEQRMTGNPYQTVPFCNLSMKPTGLVWDARIGIFKEAFGVASSVTVLQRMGEQLVQCFASVHFQMVTHKAYHSIL